MDNRERIDRLEAEKKLSKEDFVQLLSTFTPEDREYAAEKARTISVGIFGKQIYFRGIIEFTNICKNDCYYCGIRRSNSQVSRYRLTLEDILECCQEGYQSGYRTFVLQGGEDGWFTDDRMVEVLHAIKGRYPDCAITLSLGERSRESYQRMFDAGAERYLLRHETANPVHYGKLHPAVQTLENRIRCLYDLREIGYQVGCGCMVGSPYQTAECLAEDLLFMGEFKPHMIGIGPFIPHSQTPFKEFPAGSVETTLLMLSLCRIMLPEVLLPATTALGTVRGDGRQEGVLAGCNVIMPNLSPLSVRKKYMLYDNKVGTGDSAADGMARLAAQMEAIGYQAVSGRGDSPRMRPKQPV